MSLRELYWSKEEMANDLGVTPRTLDRWWAERKGPPRVYIGRTPYYLKSSGRKWLESHEQVAVRDQGA